LSLRTSCRIGRYRMGSRWELGNKLIIRALNTLFINRTMLSGSMQDLGAIWHPQIVWGHELCWIRNCKETPMVTGAPVIIQGQFRRNHSINRLTLNSHRYSIKSGKFKMAKSFYHLNKRISKVMKTSSSHLQRRKGRRQAAVQEISWNKRRK
jgi:hypothetical protein